MTTETTTLRKLLSPFLLLLLALSACTAGSDSSLSPIDPILPPDGTGNNGNNETDSATVRFSAIGIAPYGSQTAATRSGGKTLLSEQITIEDTWPDSLTARTRAPGYVPTPIAQVTLTEEPAPAGTRAASNLEVGKSFLLLAYEINALNEYKCALWCIATVQSNNSLRYAINGDISSVATSLNLLKGKYRFVAHYMPTMNSALYKTLLSGKTASDFPWNAPITMSGSYRDNFTFSGASETATEGHEVFLYDSGETVITSNSSLPITFKPVFCKVSVTVKYGNGYFRDQSNTVTDDYTRIFLAPRLLFNQDCTWTPSGKTVSYPAYSYPTGSPASVGNVKCQSSPYSGNYSYSYITSPQQNATLSVPFQTTTATKATDYLYFPDIATQGNVTMEAGKAYTLTITMSPIAHRMKNASPTAVNNLWWMAGYVDPSGQATAENNTPKWVETKTNSDTTEDLNNLCVNLPTETFGTGWRLPKNDEVTGLTFMLNGTWSIKHTIPVVRFRAQGYYYKEYGEWRQKSPMNLCIAVYKQGWYEYSSYNNGTSQPPQYNAEYRFYVKCVKEAK